MLLKLKASAVTLLPNSGALIFNLNNELWKYISLRRFVDQECQLFPWNLCAEFCAYKNSLRAVLRLSVIGDLSAIRARADTCMPKAQAQNNQLAMQPGQKLNFYFRGLLFTSHWLNLQYWTGFYISVYGNFQGLFFIFEGSSSFLHFGGDIARSPCVIFPLNATLSLYSIHHEMVSNLLVRRLQTVSSLTNLPPPSYSYLLDEEESQAGTVSVRNLG